MTSEDEAPVAEADETFGPNVRRVRTIQGLSQDALAQLVSERGRRFHQTTINKIERGERKVTIGEAIDLAAALGVELRDLSTGAPDSVAWHLHTVRHISGRLAVQVDVAKANLVVARGTHFELLEAMEALRQWARMNPQAKMASIVDVDATVAHMFASVNVDLLERAHNELNEMAFRLGGPNAGSPSEQNDG